MAKSNPTPKLAMYDKVGGVFLLVKDVAKNCLSPLSAEKKDIAFPTIDADDFDAVSKRVYPATTQELDGAKTKQKLKKIRRKADRSQKVAAIAAFCNSPCSLRDPREGFRILLLAMLARVLTLIPETVLSKIPEINCGQIDEVPSYIKVILSAVNGPEIYRGTKCVMMRPSYIYGRRNKPGVGAYSTSLYDYLGGETKALGKKKRFWLPLNNRAVCFSPSVPSGIESLVCKHSPFIIPIYCRNTNSKNAFSIKVDGMGLYEGQEGCLNDLVDSVELLQAVFDKFFSKLLDKPRKTEKLFEGMKEFYSSVYIDRGTVGKPTVEAKVYAAGLCVFREFLRYAVKHEWIGLAEQDDILATAASVLSTSTSAVEKNSGDRQAVGGWDEISTFWAFLAKYLGEHKTDILYAVGKKAVQGTRNTVAIVRTLQGESRSWLILPRKKVENSYKEFCLQKGITVDWSGPDLSRAINRIINRSKKNSGDSGWMYNFYAKDSVPEGEKGAKVTCLGIPVDELPKDIQDILRTEDNVSCSETDLAVEGGDCL